VKFWANLHKANFILYFPNKFLMIEKGLNDKGTWLNLQDDPQVKTNAYHGLIARYVALSNHYPKIGSKPILIIQKR
jgi:hypothetical protein